MQVKPIIQELIDDNRLNVEKCGLINLYWSFKFDRMKTDIDKFKKLTNELTSKRNQLNQATEDLYDLAIANQQRSTSTIEIQQELDQLNTVERTLIDKANQLEIEYKKSLIQEKTVKLQDSVNFFTNSIELIIYHFTKRNYYINKDDLFALLELPDDFFDDLPKLK
ncbi:meiotic nuclear division protein 1 [Scheffersomyces coipomensis]|uniref:meiotic nuclear division protein 1 n=1 Tax=Scheffersomyces coipomensis TaxID=1788519 RepID=UPI00315C9DC2